MSESKEALIAYCQENGRVCPLPQTWSTLYDLLPERRRIGAGWEPALPLILMAWDQPALPKMMRLREHIEWAHDHGALGPVAAYLRGLPEQDWFHTGD